MCERCADVIISRVLLARHIEPTLNAFSRRGRLDLVLSFFHGLVCNFQDSLSDEALGNINIWTLYLRSVSHWVSEDNVHTENAWKVNGKKQLNDFDVNDKRVSYVSTLRNSVAAISRNGKIYFPYCDGSNSVDFEFGLKFLSLLVQFAPLEIALEVRNSLLLNL